MAGATTSVDMSPELKRVAERAKRDPRQRLLALARFIDVPALARAYGRWKSPCPDLGRAPAGKPAGATRQHRRRRRGGRCPA